MTQRILNINLKTEIVKSKKNSRKRFKEAFEKAQQESVKNGTDNISMDEIDDIIAECRREG